MQIRTFQRGDEAAQAEIYNEAAGPLPKFKPATAQEVSRRTAAADFDPTLRLYAVEDGQPVAYVVCNANGRVSYPWCRKGREGLGPPLFDSALKAMRERGHRKVFAAYRGDWPQVLEFFRGKGFSVAREMVNHLLDIADMPTMPAAAKQPITALRRADVPALFALAPEILQCRNASELESQLFDNPHFGSDAVFVLRDSADGAPRAAGILVRNNAFTNVAVVDAAMPCFRHGAFGTDGMQTKRLNGLFSFLCKDDPQCGTTAIELLSHAIGLLEDGDAITALGCQTPSNAVHWLRFYDATCRRQASFPVLERDLS